MDAESFLRRSTFTPHLHTRFVVEADSRGRVEVELAELNEVLPFSQCADEPPREDAFALVFRGRREETFPQGLYDVEHEELGRFPLFVVPVHTPHAWRDYEAVVNRAGA